MEEDLCVGVAEGASSCFAPAIPALGRGTRSRCHRVPRGSSGRLASEVVSESSFDIKCKQPLFDGGGHDIDMLSLSTTELCSLFNVDICSLMVGQNISVGIEVTNGIGQF